MKSLLKVFITLLFIVVSINAQTFTTYSANLAHGTGTDGAFNYQRQIDGFADGDVICVQERSTVDSGWDSAMAALGLTQVVYRQNSSITDGNAIWVKSNVTVNQVFDVALSDGFLGSGGQDVDKSAVAADVTISGKRFTVGCTHLCWSVCSAEQRINQINALLSWRNSILPPNRDILFLGDFNFVPTLTSHYNILTADYVDLWQDAIDKSIAIADWGDRNLDSILDMPISSAGSFTADTRRIDYGWLNKNPSTLILVSANIPDLRATCPHALVNNGGSFPACTPEVTGLWDNAGDFGVRPSDHNFIKFTFTLAGVKKCRFHTSPSCSQ